MSDTPRRGPRRPLASEIEPDTPIWCPACRDFHPAKEFNRQSRRPSGLATTCRNAEAAARSTPEARAKTAERNKRRWANDDYRLRQSVRQRARIVDGRARLDLKRSRARLAMIVAEWKASGCVDCGYLDVRAIDPDHVDPSTKSGTVSRMIQECVSADRLRAELEKCVPRCARCHRKDTWDRRPSAWRDGRLLPPSWKRRLDNQDWNDKLKLSIGCTDCGWREWPRGLDWDHVAGVKIASVATLIANGGDRAKLLSEIAKCELRCANCHRIQTARRRANAS